MDKGTTNEIQLREKYPTATLVAYDDTPFAFTALRNGQVQAISQDGPKLIGLLANVPDRDKYEIPPFAISQDYIGVGIPKDEAALTDYVNTRLRELEASGRAEDLRHLVWPEVEDTAAAHLQDRRQDLTRTRAPPVVARAPLS